MSSIQSDGNVEAVHVVHSWISQAVKQEIPDDDVCEDSESGLGHDSMEFVRNRVNGFACPPNGDCSCELANRDPTVPSIKLIKQKCSQ